MDPPSLPVAQEARRWLLTGLAFTLLAGVAAYETHTSALQSWMFSRYLARISYRIEPGPSASIVFPRSGPFDKRTGYARLPDFLKRLETRGYRVLEQARFSPALTRLARLGVPPPYPDAVRAGLRMEGLGGAPLYEFAPIGLRFARYDDIPPLVVQTVLFIENRALQSPPDPRSNPAVEWKRLARAGLTYVASRLGLPVRLEGASTLATQIVKYRHSAGGRTQSGRDKLRQMFAASLRAYRGGTDTREERREIVLDYLNTVPLASAPGYGEVHGLGEGLRVWFGKDIGDLRRSMEDSDPSARARAFKEVLTLLCAEQAPTRFLLYDRDALEARVSAYIRLLERAGVIGADFARDVEKETIVYCPECPDTAPVRSALPVPAGRRKAVDAIRGQLAELMGVPDFYELDRLHLEVRSTSTRGCRMRSSGCSRSSASRSSCRVTACEESTFSRAGTRMKSATA